LDQEKLEMNLEQDRKIRAAFGPGTCLSELDTRSLDAIIQAAVRRTYQKAQMVCLEGEPCPGLMIIETGWLAGLKVSPQGREQEIRVAGAGEMINEISVMAGETNLLTVKALEESTVWIIQRNFLFDLMARNPILSNIITRNMANRLVHLLNLVENLALRNVEGRLAHLLLERSKDGIFHRYHWSTQAEMAACIGSTPEVVSRILNEMEDQGAIRLDRHEIGILDNKMLEAAAYQKYK
jgi:CRP-like cAMP-binding protein